MKKFTSLLISFLVPYLITIANTYYVAVDGDDNNTGTIDKPFATWQKGIDIAEPGDTVYYRGGTYTPASATFQAAVVLMDPTGLYGDGKHGNIGTKENPICLFNFPGEKPVLDCRLVNPYRANPDSRGYLTGLSIYYYAAYTHFKGLEIKNVYQKDSMVTVNGIGYSNSSNCTFENMSVHDIGGRGAWMESIVGYFGVEQDTLKVINCDFYNCADTLEVQPFNMGDGIKGDGLKGGYMYFEGVRVWNCSDDGIDISGPARKIIKNCWMFNQGINYVSIYPPDDGNGFKLGGVRDSIDMPNWIMTNCISAGNYRYAIHMADYAPYYRDNARIYNSMFYANNDGPVSFTSDKEFHNSEFYNCISYANKNRQIAIYDYPYYESHNTWDWNDSPSFPYVMTDTVTVSDDDFLSIDIGQLSLPRQANGNLPPVTTFVLAENSDLRDAGINVGLPYSGSAPDIGPSEFLEANKLSTNTINNTFSSITLNSYPNPTSGMVYIDFGSVQKNVALKISDINGKLMKQYFFRKRKIIEINIDDPPGIYILSVISEKNISTLRLIKY